MLGSTMSLLNEILTPSCMLECKVPPYKSYKTALTFFLMDFKFFGTY